MKRLSFAVAPLFFTVGFVLVRWLIAFSMIAITFALLTVSSADARRGPPNIQAYKSDDAFRGMGTKLFSPSAVSRARRYTGTNPTGMRALWCARFVNMIEQQMGRRGTGSNLARSFLSYGRRVSHPQPGDIAVLGRGRGGGHVGYVMSIDRAGNPTLVSGNYNRRVGVGKFSRRSVIAYVRP